MREQGPPEHPQEDATEGAGAAETTSSEHTKPTATMRRAESKGVLILVTIRAVARSAFKPQDVVGI